MKKVVVTGGSGKAGRATMRELVEHGYEVLNVDQAPPQASHGRDLLDVPFLQVDLTDLGQTFEALHGADAVVQLAANPSPDRFPSDYIFEHNTSIVHNVFIVATKLSMERVVWASSESILGMPFDREKPSYAPIDEEHPLYPQSAYALSKVLTEEMARHFSRWSGIPFVGLRFSNIKEPQHYEEFPNFWKDPWLRKWNLWGYVDARDVAQSCRLGLEADIEGAEVFIIAAADTVMTQPNQELMTEVFPGVPLREGTGDFETLLSIDKARGMLGYDPQHSWRDHVDI
jgi:nucleoside-diphosphate-sugar epimerase